MRRYLFLILSMGLLITLGLKGADVQKTETIEKTVAFLQSDQSGTVIVDNIYGDITILACTGNVVKATIEKTTEARSQIQFEKAVQEVILDISQEDGIIEFYVDGPFRCRHNNRRHSRWHPRKYKVIYDFKLQVPQNVNLDIRTVNEGDIFIDGVYGDYTVKNINGGIQMKNIQGSGHVYALNEDVYCRFLKNPKGDSYFGSLNGDVKLYFQSPLSAEFALKTFNGDIYSDFPSTHIPAQSVISTEHNSKNIYKCEHPSRIRIGKGGPLFEFDGFNGDLFILKNQQ